MSNVKGTLPWMRRHGLLLLVIVVVMGVAAVAARSQLASLAAPPAGSAADASGQASCTPQPCAAPNGFEAYFTPPLLADGHVTLQVRFRNHTTPEALEAVSYRHTSPDDFRLKGSEGQGRAPVFSANCPDWGELRIERGDSAGPEVLCFDALPAGLSGAAIVWGPDLGFLSRDVTVPLKTIDAGR